MGATTRCGPAAPPWGSVLQEKFVNAHAVACCPTMDLIAVLTADRQLLVHRTISWQRVLHVKPSDVYFTFETLTWSPDGMRLAVGCDEGELVVYSMAADGGSGSGVEVKSCGEDDQLRHETKLVAMHWVLVRADAEDRTKVVPPSAMLRNRCAVFASASTGNASAGRVEEDSVLVTADAAGRVGIWWNGLELVAMIPTKDHWCAQATAQGIAQADEQESLTVRSIMMATDLSTLLIDMTHGSDEKSMERYVLRLDLRSSLQAMQHDLQLVSHIGYEMRSIVESIRTALRQITSEWKNATRVFELKMSLMGSLYEKYGCEEPPQVDMLAVIAGGITPPALAQYFAQDIQEMSVIRMQKMFISGCDTIQTLIDSKVKVGLQHALYEVAELRGAVKWNCHAFHHTLGISTDELGVLVDHIGTLIVTMEQIEKLLHETRQDFCLFFSWLLERIKIHTNDGGFRSSQVASAVFEGSQSLLNLRRLTAFLERASEEAKVFQEKKRTKYQVEVTFGNPVSRTFSSPNFVRQFNVVGNTWDEVTTRMVRSLSASVTSSEGYLLPLGGNVDDVFLHTRWLRPAQTRGLYSASDGTDDDQSENEEEDDNEFDVTEAVDWDSLASIHTSASQSSDKVSSTIIAVRSGSCFVIFACPEGAVETSWNIGCFDLAFLESLRLRCFSMYGGLNSGKQEHIVLAFQETEADTESSLLLLSYDALLHTVPTWIIGSYAERRTILSKVSRSVIRKHNGLVKWRTIRIPSFSTSTIITQASRGVVCYVTMGTRLVIFDAEEAGDEDSCNGDNNAEPRDDDAQESDDHAEVDL